MGNPRERQKGYIPVAMASQIVENRNYVSPEGVDLMVVSVTIFTPCSLSIPGLSKERKQNSLTK